MYIVYECPKCRNRGYLEETSTLTCSLCGTLIPSGASKIRVQDEDAAKTELMKRIARASRASDGKIKRGLGTRRRVLSVVESLVELRRGRPVSMSTILEECSEAGIDSEKALHHLSLLLDSGEVISTSEGYRPGTIEEVL